MNKESNWMALFHPTPFSSHSGRMISKHLMSSLPPTLGAGCVAEHSFNDYKAIAQYHVA